MAVLIVLTLRAAPSAAAGLSAAEFVKLALAASPEVRQAEESYRSADASYKSSLAAMVLPSLSFTLRDSVYGHDAAAGNAFHGARLAKGDRSSDTALNWNLFNGFNDLLRTRIASEGRDAAASALEVARQARSLAAIQAFYHLAAAARLREVAQLDLKSQEEQYRQTQALYKSGMKGLSDLYKSETEWHSSEIRMISAESSYKASLEPFNSLLDRAPWAEAETAAELQPGTTELPRLEEDAARLPARRREIAGALLAARKAELSEKQSLLRLFPTVTADASWSRSDAAGAGVLTGRAYQRVGVALSLPIGFNAASQAFDYGAARAERRRAKAAVDEALRSARDELYSAWISLETATRTYELSVRQEEIAAKGLEIVEAQYRQGGADALRMAQARSDLLSARVQTATSLQNIFLSRAAYDRAAGVSLW